MNSESTATTAEAEHGSAPNNPPTVTLVKRYFAHVPLEHIARNPKQPRRTFDPLKLTELGESIRTHGQIQPIALLRVDMVDPDDADRPCRYMIIAGERRWRAMRMDSGRVGEIAALVYEGISYSAAHEMALIENIDREDLNPIEEAEGLLALKEEHSYTQHKLSERLGIPRATIANTLRLLKLPPAVQDMLRGGKLTAAHGIALLRFDRFPAVMTAMATCAFELGETASYLEKGIPFVHRPAVGSLIDEVTPESMRAIGIDPYSPETDKTLRALPFIHVERDPDAEGAADTADDIFWIFDLPAWNAWHAERKAAYDAANAAKLTAAAKPGKKPKAGGAAAEPKPGDSLGFTVMPASEAPSAPVSVLYIRSLGWDSYKKLEDLSASIRKQIPDADIEQAMDYNDKPIDITRNMSLVNGLIRSESAKKNKTARARLDAAWGGAVNTLTTLDNIAPGDMALIAVWACRSASPQVARDAATALGVKFPKDCGIEAAFAKLAKTYSCTDLLRLGIAIVLRWRFQDAFRAAADVPPELAEYAGDYEAAMKKEAAAEKAKTEETDLRKTLTAAGAVSTKKKAAKKTKGKAGEKQAAK